MRFLIGSLALAGLILFFAQACGSSGPVMAHLVDDDSLVQARKHQVEEVLRTIEGKEELPAAEVFENIENFKRVPAGRLLRIMDMGFGRSLGVGCDHCHDVDDFASDDKRPKRAAREMMAMSGAINDDLLAGVENLDPDRPANERPMVNCTTCHRGEVRPALEME